jgi:hypothetical protein
VGEGVQVRVCVPVRGPVCERVGVHEPVRVSVRVQVPDARDAELRKRL